MKAERSPRRFSLRKDVWSTKRQPMHLHEGMNDGGDKAEHCVCYPRLRALDENVHEL
jgi:hypothetical protein